MVRSVAAFPEGDDTVNVTDGVKIVRGDADVDFTLDAPLPLVWQRTYTSRNTHAGWLGQGWSVSFGQLRLSVNTGGIILHTLSGERTGFQQLAVGKSFFRRHEQVTLKRNQLNQYEIISPDGSRQLFGLPPSDRARLAAFGEEVASIAQEQRDWLDESVAPPPASSAKPAPQADTLVLLSIADANNNALHLDYNADDLPASLETSSGQKIYFEFKTTRSGESRLTQISRNGYWGQQHILVRYRYNEAGDLTEVFDSEDRLCRRFRWQNHILVEHSEPGGLTVQIDWDQHTPKGKVLKQSSSSGQSWEFHYDTTTRHTLVIEADGRFSDFHYNERRHLLARTDPLGHTTRYELDPWGNIETVTDPLGRQTNYAYDGHGRIVYLEQADGEGWQISWHPQFSAPLSVTDPLGRVTQNAYDARGNLIKTIGPDGGVTAYERDLRGLVVNITDAHGGQRHFEYNEAGDLRARIDCTGKRTAYEYDDEGNLASVTDAAGYSTRYRWCKINRRSKLECVDYPDGAQERVAYDELGRLIAHRDPLGHITRYHLDDAGRPLTRINALGHSLQYAYDVHGRLAILTNENGARYRFAWDPADRLLGEDGFDGRQLTYHYDAADNLIASSDGPEAGPHLRTRYEHDLMGRLITKYSAKHGSYQRVRYAYDAIGQLTLARNANARIEICYTVNGGVAREVSHSRDGQETRLDYQYDVLGNRIATVLPDGRTINTLTYGSGHAHQINLDQHVICDFDRDALHREIRRTQGQLGTDYALDAMGRLLQSRVSAKEGSNGTPTPGQRIARRYQYDTVGQLLTIEDPRRKQTTRYGYDAIGRLTRAVSPHADERFAFDPAHNLIGTDETQPSQPAQAWTDEEWAEYVREHFLDPDFNPLEQPSRKAAPNRLYVWEEHRYHYDDWGNCIEKRSGAHTVRKFAWDAEHQLTRLTLNRKKDDNIQTEQWGYDYDPFGRRIAKYRIEGKKKRDLTRYSWDENRLLLERKDGAQQIYVYEPGDFVPLALVRSHYAHQASAKQQPRIHKEPGKSELVEILYFHNDHMGTPRELTDAEGNIVWQASYRVWGRTEKIDCPPKRVLCRMGNTIVEQWEEQSPVTQNLRFQGQYFDEESGLHYNLFRYYDADVGRYLSPDPIGLAGGGNAFTYVNNSPVNLVDPLGLIPCTCKKIKMYRTPRDSISDIYNNRGDYGHWWIEIGNKSYGWWPKVGVGIITTFLGVEGVLNAGNGPHDPYHGEYPKYATKPGSKSFHPNIKGGVSDGFECLEKCAKAKKCIEDFAKNYTGQWAWPIGNNCHSFQKQAMKKCGLKE